MPQRDMIVIGGSAGSVRVLRTILHALPADLPASIFVVIHVSPETPAVLEDQLAQQSYLPVSYPVDGEPIRASHVYLARPDCHLLIEDGRMRVLRGPRENRHRPAIDPLFRTAARTYGARVIGLILSGIHDDGSAGLYAVKQRGGCRDCARSRGCCLRGNAVAHSRLCTSPVRSASGRNPAQSCAASESKTG